MAGGKRKGKAKLHMCFWLITVQVIKDKRRQEERKEGEEEIREAGWKLICFG